MLHWVVTFVCLSFLHCFIFQRNSSKCNVSWVCLFVCLFVCLLVCLFGTVSAIWGKICGFASSCSSGAYYFIKKCRKCKMFLCLYMYMYIFIYIHVYFIYIHLYLYKWKCKMYIVLNFVQYIVQNSAQGAARHVA